MNAYKKRKVLFYIQIILTFAVFGLIYLGSKDVVPFYASWIILGIYLAVMIYRMKFSRDNFVVQKIRRSKGVQMALSLVPIGAVLSFFFGNSENGLNVMGAAVLLSASLILENRLTIYTTKEDWNKRVKENKKKNKKNKKK